MTLKTADIIHCRLYMDDYGGLL